MPTKTTDRVRRAKGCARLILQTGRDLTRWSWLQLRHGAPEFLLHFGFAIGDDLLCTAVARELKKRGQGAIWMMSQHPAIFEGNPDIDRVLPVHASYERFARATRGCGFPSLDYAPVDAKKERSTPPARHIIAELCVRAGIQGDVSLRPYFHLTDAERQRADWATGMIVLQSSGLGARWPIRNKEWFPDRMQKVVDGLIREYPIVQIGSPQDPLMNGAVDLRGQTTPRELAAVLSRCRLYIGTVGFPMHLARAVECPAVIVFGGREAPWQSGYSANVNIHSDLPCSPCWLWNSCEFDRACMKQIEARDVIEAAHVQLAIPRAPLPVDFTTI